MTQQLLSAAVFVNSVKHQSAPYSIPNFILVTNESVPVADLTRDTLLLLLLLISRVTLCCCCCCC
jgi:hypothetical protein